MDKIITACLRNRSWATENWALNCDLSLLKGLSVVFLLLPLSEDFEDPPPMNGREANTADIDFKGDFLVFLSVVDGDDGELVLSTLLESDP